MALKVLIVGDEFPPDIGGAATYTANLCKALAKIGVDVTLALPARLRGSEFIPPDVNVSYFDGFVIPVLMRMFSGRAAKKLRDLIRYGGFDVVHGQDIHSSAALFSIWYCKRRRIPSVITCHTVRKTIGRWSVLYHPVMRVVKKATMVIGVSDQAAETCVNFGVPPWKVRVVPNGVDLSIFYPKSEKEKEEVKRKYGLDGKVVFSAVRIKKLKGVHVLVKAFVEIVKEVPDARLVIAGKGKDLPEVVELARKLGILEKVNFLGPKPVTEIAKLMAAADVFVLPSLSEAFGMAILEAMASGTPVVSTRTTGSSLIVRDGINGILVPVGDHSSLAKAVVRVLTDENLSKSLRANGLETVRNFTIDVMAKRVLEVYEEAIRLAK
ncbi:MAG: glycosyltransferase family 4 protein [Candidatus Hadarchaeales archaeon]